MPTPLARLVAHWPLKLASLALAVLLWALVSAEQVTTHWIPVTVEAEVRDPRYVLTGGPGPAEVRVLFAGPGRILWQLALNRPSLVLPVREPEGGGYALGPEMIRFPEGVRGVVVRDIRPAVVRLDMERIATREVPVRPRFSPSPDDRWVVRGTPEVSPSTVRVSGPAEDVQRIRYLETRPVEVASSDSATFAASAAVDVAGLPHFTVWPTTVRVSGEVDLRMQRPLVNVPIRGADGSVRGSADLRLTGPSRVLAELGPQVWIEESGTAVRIRGVPASVTATLVARRAAVDATVDSATAP